MKKVFAYLKPYRAQCILAPLFKLLEVVFELFVPFVVAYIIDEGIHDKNAVGKVFGACGILLLLAVVGFISAATAQYFSSVAAVGFATALRAALFRHLQGLSYRELDKLGTATMMTRMTGDINQAQTGVNLTLRLLLRSPFVVFGAMIMAFVIDWELALIFVAVIVALFLVVGVIMWITLPMHRHSQEKLDGVLERTRENLTGARVVRAFCMEESEEVKFAEANHTLTRSRLFAGRISALTNPLTYVIINIGVIFLVWQGGLRVNDFNDKLTQGQVVALYNYMAQILIELVKFANFIVTFTRGLASGRRIASVFEINSTLQEGDTSQTPVDNAPAIAFRDATISYAGSQEAALSHVSFVLPRGGTLGVIGGTGSGKTTLVNLIPRFYDVTDGVVMIDGVDVREYPLEQLRAKIGVVPQKARLFAGTIRDNLKWGNPDATDEELYAALKTAQALDVVASKPGGLDEQVDAGGRNFSGGQRQRLTIARALVRRPEILILDDSASALDYLTDARLRRALKTDCGDSTVVIVSQRTSSVRHADLILVLDDGEVVGMGTHEALMESCAVYQEIARTQEKEGA